ncbi:recombinase family protein [Synechococcus sp. CS-205]|uniref:recombinase family protein n=1 Tax=Synechococcus sp. CS-205 TaxID=2847984 RepID=UPI00223ABE0C|nr:recombinase family protein [Synechococcus sp. CS-205]MCT0247469.1 recombinase family protein [Synechococcus sp. CS-205]
MEMISYYRVSTDQQGRSGLGLEAQRERVQQLAKARGAQIVAEYTEVESGRKASRPQLAAALAEARKRKAAIAVAKLDRLARDAELILRLSREAEANGMAGFLFADLPDIDATTSAGRLILGVMATVAEFESRRISERTKEALTAAKARGVKLGGANPSASRQGAVVLKANATAEAEKVRGLLQVMQGQGLSLSAMAAELNRALVAAPRGGRWYPATVRRALIHLGLKES